MLYPESTWKSIAEAVTKPGQVIMVIGRTDTGKSFFCRYLASVGIEKGLNVAIVDADVGQSWIGPPTTVGMMMVKGEPTPTLFPDSFYFVGYISPERHLLQIVVGTKRMADKALSSGADMVIVDTTGLVDGNIGRVLKTSKVDLVRPDHLVCFQRGSELEALIKGIETNRHCHIYRLEPPKEAKRKSQDNRRDYRQRQFQEYFSEFVTHEFHFSKLHGLRTTFLNGRRANPQELENLSKIANDIALYAEWSFKGLFIVTVDRISEISIGNLCRYFSLDDVFAHTPEDFSQLLTALVDEQGEPICLAIIEKVNFNQNVIVLKFKKEALELARAIQFSNFRLAPECPATTEGMKI